MKWGIWTFEEYARMIDGVAALRERHSHIKFVGPSAIDFEYHYLVTALHTLRGRFRFDALSHLLYVDRRGAPENPQGPFAALEKFALARAIAQGASACRDKLLVTEVNWPLKDTGVYSPIGSPYLYPGQQVHGASVSESDYADYMLRYLVQAICSGMVERVYWWRLVARGFGLVDDTDARQWRTRPAYDALKYFLSRLGQSTFTEKLTSPEDTYLFAFERPDGERVVLAYTTRDRATVSTPGSCRALVDRDGKDLGQPGSEIDITGQPVYMVEG